MTATNSHLVTIVIIAYNEERYLSEAIESVLNQTYQPIEIILVDDGSTDNTLAVARRYEQRIKVVSQKNSGGCSSPRNHGLRLAKGKFIGFLDGDDIFLPNKISSQVAAFEKYFESAMIVCNFCNFTRDEKFPDHFSTCPELTQILPKSGELFEFARGSGATLMIEENFANAVTPLYRIEVVRKHGGFSEDLKSCEDFHLNFRVARDNKIGLVNEILFMRRLHGLNMTSNKLNMLKYDCLSRLDLAADESNAERKAHLRKRVWAYFRAYCKGILKKGAVGHLKYAVIILKKYFSL